MYGDQQKIKTGKKRIQRERKKIQTDKQTKSSAGAVSRKSFIILLKLLNFMISAWFIVPGSRETHQAGTAVGTLSRNDAQMVLG